jgi:uncharacterized protein
MSGTFEIYKDKKGEFRFRLKATNGEIIAVGEGYSTKQNCIKGIESVKKAVAGAKTVEAMDGQKTPKTNGKKKGKKSESVTAASNTVAKKKGRPRKL